MINTGVKFILFYTVNIVYICVVLVEILS